MSPPIAPATTRPSCPFPGMRAYTSDEAHLFFGREKMVSDLAEQLRDGVRGLILLGPSGCGKTSLVQAGLWPSLLAGEAPYSVRALSSESNPIEALELAVRALDSRRPMLLVIDTLATVLTLPLPSQREFFAILTNLYEHTRCQLLLVLSTEFRDLFDPQLCPFLENAPRFPLHPLTDEPLIDVIRATAKSADIELEEGLLIELKRDAAQEPGAMPLLQQTLCELWRALDSASITASSYRDLSEGKGLGRAATRRAKTTLSKGPDRDVVMRLLLRLVHFCEGRPHTRHRRAKHELLDDEASEGVLRLLVTEGLVTEHPGLVYDLAHDTLIRSWEELAQFVARNIDDERQRRHWQDRAEKHAQQQGDLLGERELVAAETWHDRAAATVGCSPLLADYLAESRRVLDEQARRAALTQARQYLAQAQSSLMGARGAKAAPYLVEARALLDRHDKLGLPERLLFGWAARALPISKPPWQPSQWIEATLKAHSPDQRFVARIDEDRLSVRVFRAPRSSNEKPDDKQPRDTRGRDETASPQLETREPIERVAWSDDSRLLAAQAGAETLIWNAIEQPEHEKHEKHERPTTVPTEPFPSPDGKKLATIANKRVRLTSEGRACAPELDHKAPVIALAWSPCSTCLATATSERTLRIWDAAMGYQVQRELVATGPVQHLEWIAPSTLRITTEESSYERHLDPTDLADWRAAAAKSPYHLVDGVLLRKEPTAP